MDKENKRSKSTISVKKVISTIITIIILLVGMLRGDDLFNKIFAQAQEVHNVEGLNNLTVQTGPG